MKKFLKIVGIIAIVIFAGLAGLVFYGRYVQQQTGISATALLDYKNIDEHHMSHEMMETFVKACANSALSHGAPRERAVKGCACVANHIASSITEQEFKEYDTALVMKVSPNAQTSSKMVAIVTDCRNNP